MRDGLTFLAGLVLLALLGALVGPHFVDWNQHRAVIEQQLRRATGIDLVTTGPIHLRFLPSPRIEIAGLRVGDADPMAAQATIRFVRADMELMPLIKGEVSFGSVALDGANVAVIADRGGVVLPRLVADGAALPTVAELSITNSELTLRDAAGAAWFTSPFSAVARLPQAAGPSRFEAEVAGRSIRLTTGDRDGAGRVRVKLALSDAAVRGEFDGWVGIERLPEANGRMSLMPDGQLQATVPSQADGQPPLTLTGQLKGTAAGFALTGLTSELPAIGRIEGSASWSGRSGEAATVALQSRRLDLGPLLAPDGSARLALGPALPLLEWLPDLDLRLSAEQLSYRGEEATDAQIALQRRGQSWQARAGQLTFAGAEASLASSGPDQLQIAADIPDLRRIALAMQRLDMPQALAEDIAALGQIKASADLARLPDGWRLARWQAEGRFGKASGEGAVTATNLTVKARVEAADVLFLVRPVMALAALARQDVALDISGQQLRIGGSAPGSGAVLARRLGGQWRIEAASARGFEGLAINVTRPAPDQPLAFTIEAARADQIGALAERFTQSDRATQILRALKGLAPVSAAGTLRERSGDWLITAGGRAGQLTVEAAGRIGHAGDWRGGEVTLTSADRGSLFRMVGLPAPAEPDVATRLSARFGDGGPTVIVIGADGLAIEARGRWEAGRFGVLAGPMDVAFDAPRRAALLPAFADGGGEGGALEGRLSLRLGDGVIAFDAIEAAAAAGRLTGHLQLGPEGRITGALTLPGLDVAVLAGQLTGGGPILTENGWSGARFAAPTPLPELAIALSSEAVTVPHAPPMSGSLRLTSGGNLARLSDIDLKAGSMRIKGAVEAERDGGLLALRANGEIGPLDLAGLLGSDFGGQGLVALQLGASGESPARMVASLAGSGQVKTANLVINRLDPGALERIVAGDFSVGDTAQLAQSVRRNVEAAAWPFAPAQLALVITGGLVRMSPVADDRPGAKLNLSGSIDLRSGVADLRAAMQSSSPLPKDWSGPPPQVALNWRGLWRGPQRSYDVSALSNAVAQRALQREIERVEALEADIRERAQFNRRLRAERDRQEAEQRAAAAERQRQEQARQEQAREERAREERARTFGPEFQPALAPPLPPPLNISPVPSPLSRPSSSFN